MTVLEASDRHPLDAIALSDAIEQRYRNYLQTTFQFRDPDLRESFETALSSGVLRQGPYLEGSRAFQRGESPAKLLTELLGSTAHELLKGIPGDRRLYQHQEAAIRTVTKGRNLVVATGTGSGKTESFLYPILTSLFQEHVAGTLDAGVRALILYPMNALANDQRERLGQICSGFDGAFQISFGQYTGETPEDQKDRKRRAGEHERVRLPGELVFREEMRATPPHILLTNYSMLEYLLLRPDDSPLFDDGSAGAWEFLVLDEAHQYRGSKGIEMSMLIRRLKDRLRNGGRTGPFRCIATSASLAGGDSDNSSVAKFASDLFGEPFNESDVITGTTETIELSPKATLPEAAYRDCLPILRGGDTSTVSRLHAVAESLAIPIDAEPQVFVRNLMLADRRATELVRCLGDGPQDVRVLADSLFSNTETTDRPKRLAELVEVLVRAVDPITGSPLLAARYHLFLRSLEGAFVRLYPQPEVLLERKSDPESAPVFEVALCRECGQHYFVAQLNAARDGKLREPVRDPAESSFGVSFLRPLDANSQRDDALKTFNLCTRCGELSAAASRCGHNDSIQLVMEPAHKDEDRADQIQECGFCGYGGAGRDPVREIVYGTDGPHSVIATTLFREAPAERRRILAFADGRQEAAFFAWYVEESYREILNRNLLYKSIREASTEGTSASSFREIATSFRALAKRNDVYPASMGDRDLLQEAWLAIFREFVTDEPRISLEGVGLIRWSIDWPQWLTVPPTVTSQLGLDDGASRTLLMKLLDLMRLDRAVELVADAGTAIAWADLEIQASQQTICLGQPRQKGDGPRALRSWDGAQGRRAQYLARVLRRLDSSLAMDAALEKAQRLLRELWQAILETDSRAQREEDRLLLPMPEGRRLNPSWWRVTKLDEGAEIFQCDTCRRPQPTSTLNVCPRFRCEGTLVPIQVGALVKNHYRDLYISDLPGVLRAEEHTAQLSHEKARDFQRDFRNGRIHVLSSSTTFELGVDLGDLDTVFLRNVPPEAFNYVQRVGRAGRRAGFTGFAVTYCRRSPHDLYHFQNPGLMMSGRTKAPTLTITNEKILSRHVAAVALSSFFRTADHVSRFGSVESLFRDLESPDLTSTLFDFLNENRRSVETSLRSIVPAESLEPLGITGGSWISRICGTESRLALTEAETKSDFEIVKRLEKSSAESGDYKTAVWAKARAITIADENVLGFLSRKGVIPKYGFPVDVVDLDTLSRDYKNKGEVQLQRDLSIGVAEFAPTSKLIANKKIWTSYGLKRVAEKEWRRVLYKRCARHNIFVTWQRDEPEPPTQCEDRLVASTYIIPQFGFVTSRKPPTKPTGRTPKLFTSRPYFIGLDHPSANILQIPAHKPLINLHEASPGTMAVLCEGRKGRGFYVCGDCGAGFRKREKRHRTPFDTLCEGVLADVSLGHEFRTDVVQLDLPATAVSRSVEDAGALAHSLAYALVEGTAETLAVPSNDLNATVRQSSAGRMPPIILYDNVPGGAGLVARLHSENELREALEAARDRVSGACGCGEDTTCYGCLRSYRNQFLHSILRRGDAHRYLDDILSQWAR